MKRFLSICLLASAITTQAQTTGSFVVGGSINNYYPVTFADGAWSSNIATDLQIGRSYVHTDTLWRGAVIADFRFHSNNWGNAANFIDADIRTSTTGTITNFVGGWQDVSSTNSSTRIVIWLRGGTTTYYYNANATVSPVVYDGVANALPFTPSGGSALTYKTAADSYVSTQGKSSAGNLQLTSNLVINGGGSYGQMDINSDLHAGYQFVAGGSFSGTAWAGKMIINYANYQGNNARLTIDSTGKVGIGTASPQSLLAVKGTVTCEQVTVTQTGWSDFVFAPGYHLPSLDSVATYAAQHRHLPGVPSEAELDKSGLDLGAMQKLQMQKIEELTLYCAQLAKENKALRREIDKIKKAH